MVTMQGLTTTLLLALDLSCLMVSRHANPTHSRPTNNQQTEHVRSVLRGLCLPDPHPTLYHQSPIKKDWGQFRPRPGFALLKHSLAVCACVPSTSALPHSSPSAVPPFSPWVSSLLNRAVPSFLLPLSRLKLFSLLCMRAMRLSRYSAAVPPRTTQGS